MARLPADPENAQWIQGNEPDAQYVLAGSAAPSLSLDDLVSLSTDPAATERALNFRSLSLGLGSPKGSLELRSAVAALYDEGAGIKPDHVITATGTTGANLTVFQSFLHSGDHVICLYPTYPQLLGLPRGFTCEVARWNQDPDNDWKLDMEELRKMVKPTTKMIILNNPNNPTGAHIDAQTQERIIEIARRHNIIILVDEIFRPLFHQTGPVPPSFVEHDYSRTVVTSSMSKVWGMSGVRIGWIVCKDQTLITTMLNTKQYICQATSSVDEIIATETLSHRCRPVILERHLSWAKKNLELLDAFVKQNNDVCAWTRPTAGATAFLKFFSASGEAVDDVEFGRRLLSEQRVLISPGSLCFGEEQTTDFGGFFRVHFTVVPEYMEKALRLIDAYLDKKRNEI